MRSAIKIPLATVCLCALSAPAALAGAGHATASPGANTVRIVTTVAPQSEAKNEPPFTARYSADPGLAPALRKVATMVAHPTTPVVPTAARAGYEPAGGFRWADASIGALSMLGICLVFLGIVLAARRTGATPEIAAFSSQSGLQRPS